MQPNVFIVSEKPQDLPIVHNILVAAGYAVEAFEHSDALLPRIEACTRGCVVIDSNLPGASGLELQSKLIDHGIELPVLFISANADVTTVVTAMKKGALDFLTKPLNPPSAKRVGEALPDCSTNSWQRNWASPFQPPMRNERAG